MARSMIWVTLGCTLFPLLAQAAPNDKLAQRLAASCAGCHGTAGVAAGGSLPALAGHSRRAPAALTAIRRRSRSSSRIARLSRTLSISLSWTSAS